MSWKLFRYPTIMSGVVFRWKLGESEINASRDGVSIVGQWPIMSGFGAIRAAMNAAEFAHSRLAKDRDWDPPEIHGFDVFDPPPFGSTAKEPKPDPPDLLDGGTS